eukprot:6194014-Pleurochrysis_carterae.AAC.1
MAVRDEKTKRKLPQECLSATVASALTCPCRCCRRAAWQADRSWPPPLAPQACLPAHTQRSPGRPACARARERTRLQSRPPLTLTYGYVRRCPYKKRQGRRRRRRHTVCEGARVGA